MRKKIKAVTLFLLFLSAQIAFGQTNKENALIKGREAIKLMDDGKVEESIKLLEEAQKLDSEKFDYPYEKAYAYYLKKDYKEAIRILEEIINLKMLMNDFSSY